MKDQDNMLLLELLLELQLLLEFWRVVLLGSC